MTVEESREPQGPKRRKQIILSILLTALLALVSYVTVQNTHEQTFPVSSQLRRQQQLVNNYVEHNDIKIAVKAHVQWNRSRVEFPCIHEDSPHTQGIFFIKVPKTSSTTLAHITMRIAGREAKRQRKHPFDTSIERCKVHDPLRHRPAYVLDIRHRDKTRSLLWTMVRDPTTRAISHFSMKVATGAVPDASFSTLVDTLQNDAQHAPNSQLRFVSSISSPMIIPEDQFHSYIRSVIDEYDFIGIYDRLHESLVVLSLLLDINVQDILYEYSVDGCVSVEQKKPKWLSPAMEAYLQSAKWRQREMGDFLLYDAASRALDLTIQKIGPQKVATRLKEFEDMLMVGRKALGVDMGCGIPELRQHPYDDVQKMDWFQKLLPEDQEIFAKGDDNIHAAFVEVEAEALDTVVPEPTVSDIGAELGNWGPATAEQQQFGDSYVSSQESSQTSLVSASESSVDQQSPEQQPIMSAQQEATTSTQGSGLYVPLDQQQQQQQQVTPAGTNPYIQQQQPAQTYQHPEQNLQSYANTAQQQPNQYFAQAPLAAAAITQSNPQQSQQQHANPQAIQQIYQPLQQQPQQQLDSMFQDVQELKQQTTQQMPSSTYFGP